MEMEKNVPDTIDLYHYTSKEGQEGILDSGVIFESTESGSNDDAAFGDGVYLTSLPPSEGKIDVALNNYDGSERDVRDVLNSGRVDCYVKVTLDVNDVDQVKSDRDIYVYQGDLELDDAIDVAIGDVDKY